MDCEALGALGGTGSGLWGHWEALGATGIGLRGPWEGPGGVGSRRGGAPPAPPLSPAPPPEGAPRLRQEEGGSLTIANVTRGDAGAYGVLCRNAEGAARAQLRLHVHCQTHGDPRRPTGTHRAHRDPRGPIEPIGTHGDPWGPIEPIGTHGDP